MKLRSFLAALFAGMVLTGAEFTVPQTAKAPTVDGKISQDEWKDALVISGTGATVDPRKAELFLTWDEKNLYAAVRVETPPRGKLVKNAGNHPIYDDSVEFWFDPPKSARAKA